MRKLLMVATLALATTTSLADDLGRCKSKDATGSWLMLITFRPTTLGVQPEYSCDMRISAKGKVEAASCTDTYYGEEKTTKVIGAVKVSQDCSVSMKLTMTRERGSLQFAEKLSFDGIMSADRSRLFGTYTSSLQHEDIDFQGRIDAARRP